MKINLLCVFCCPESHFFFSPPRRIFRTPRGLAIAGLVISCIALIVLIILVSAIASLV